jgi:hypothetical protein
LTAQLPLFALGAQDQFEVHSQHFFVFMIRCRTVAKVLSMGLLVWMRFQCSAGKS